MMRERKVRVYQTAVTVLGLALWVVALTRIVWMSSLSDQMIILALIPVTVVVGFFSHHLQAPMGKRIGVMEKAHRQTIEALAVAINAKDEVTREHVFRVQIYAAGVARLLGCAELEEEAVALLGAALSSGSEAALPEMYQPPLAAQTASLIEYKRTAPLHRALVESELKH